MKTNTESGVSSESSVRSRLRQLQITSPRLGGCWARESGLITEAQRSRFARVESDNWLAVKVGTSGDPRIVEFACTAFANPGEFRFCV